MDEKIIRQMKVQELQEELKKKNLDTSGKKMELVERLIASLRRNQMEQKGSMNTSTQPSSSKNKSKDHTTSIHTSTSMKKEKRERKNEKEEEEEEEDSKAHHKKQKIQKEKEEEDQKNEDDENQEQVMTETLRIDNFRRPFTLPAVKKLVQELDEYVDDGFWMNSIKTHCYVTYKNTQAALAAKKLLHGKIWPVDTGRSLSVSFSALKANEVTDSTTESNISSSTSRNNKSWENTMSHSGKKTTSSRFSIDTFFHKTNTLPKLYYLPIDEKIAQERKKQLVSQRERSTSSTAATIDSTSVAPSLISSSR